MTRLLPLVRRSACSPRRGRLRQQAGRQCRSAAPGGHGLAPAEQKITEWDEYTGRFVAGEDRRSARPRLGLHQFHPFQGWPDRQAGRPSVRHRSRGPIGSRSSRPRPISSAPAPSYDVATLDLERATPLLRSQTVTEREFDTRRVDAAGGGRRGRRGRSRAEAGRAQSRMDRGARADRRPHLRPARRCRQPDHRRPDRRDAADLDRVDRSDPFRLRRQRGRLPALSCGSPRPVRGHRRATCRIRSRCGSPTRPNTSTSDGWTSSTTWSTRRTGTIRGRAIFENKDGLLTPGFFGRLRLFGGERDALLLPDAAIASDQANKIVFTVADDGTVGDQARRARSRSSTGCASSGPALRRATAWSSKAWQRARPGQKVTARGRQDRSQTEAKPQ